MWRYITQPENIDFYDPYISFNYFGEIDKSIYDFEKWSFDFENSGESVSEVNVQKKLLLDINGWQANNEMIFYFSYSEKVFSEDNITAIIECFVNYLEKIAVHCSNQKNVELTSSDYGFYKLSQEEFEEIISAYNDYTVQDIYPVAPLQTGFIYNALKNPEADHYFTQMSFDLVGDVDLNVYLQAWQRTVDELDILRTAFDWRHKEFAQIVVKSVDCQLISMIYQIS